MISGHGPNPIFFNKILKNGRPEQSLPSPPPPPLPPLRPITSYFCLLPHPLHLPKSGRHMRIMPNCCHTAQKNEVFY